MSERSYIREKFVGGIRPLASGTEPIQQRLVDAFTQELFLVGEDDLPSGRLREEWRTIKAAMSAVPGEAGEGSFRASTRAMSDEEARALAGRILDVAWDVIDPFHGECGGAECRAWGPSWA